MLTQCMLAYLPLCEDDTAASLLDAFCSCALQQPPTPEGRHFHQTCLGRGAHLNMSRKILHWSGRSNSNKRKKVGATAASSSELSPETRCCL